MESLFEDGMEACIRQALEDEVTVDSELVEMLGLPREMIGHREKGLSLLTKMEVRRGLKEGGLNLLKNLARILTAPQAPLLERERLRLEEARVEIERQKAENRQRELAGRETGGQAVLESLLYALEHPAPDRSLEEVMDDS